MFEPKKGPVDPPKTWRHAPHSLLHSATTVIGDNLAMMVKGQLLMHFFKLPPLGVVGMGTQKLHIDFEAAWPQGCFGRGC